eukprot:CAMPEP_0115526080 /NCGR_PEP_ID=MMETSP0271-20121206/82103_1 /TAXON_ID=71861 /ORGANISM="Scrippsiella trochoidea, Strain CCMP3099" /LENGTH=83 /DNA_ID=CAMNT_0002957783 /DNA_START=248 /DNA_END=495 /DNA_ORIENTATION=-
MCNAMSDASEIASSNSSPKAASSGHAFAAAAVQQFSKDIRSNSSPWLTSSVQHIPLPKPSKTAGHTRQTSKYGFKAKPALSSS